MSFGQLNVAIQIYNICKGRLGSRGEMGCISERRHQISDKKWLILHTPGPEIRQHVAYIYIDTPCAYPPSYPSIRYA